MSAYKTIKCSFKDKNTLVECLKNIGYNPVIYKEKHSLIGYMGDAREQEAEIVVPKSQISRLSNDVGFTYNADEDEFSMLCSDFDLNLGVGDKIKQSYAVVAIKNALKKNKFTINSEVKNKDKSITITGGKIIWAKR